MPITEVKQALGSFSLTLRSNTPREILDAMTYWGHIAVLEGRVNPAEYGDELLSSARYVGVYRNRDNNVDNRTHNVDGFYRLRGVGMCVWLGDEGGKGAVFESSVDFSGATFANTIRGLLPDAVTEGTLHTVAGTYTGSHQWVTPRQALNYVAETFAAEWRVNGDGSLDAGTVAQLYPTVPTAMLVKHGYGRDLTTTAYKGKIDSGEDAEEFSTRVVVLAKGEGSSIAVGSANISSNPYKDLQGNPVQITRAVSESKTEAINANVRAQIELDAVSHTRRSLRLAASDYDVSDTLRVGEYVWVYDPDTGLIDTLNEVMFRGQRISPAKFRCVEMTWPVVDGMTIAYRNPNGVWIDLTDYVRFEDAADVTITIGDLPRSLTGGGVEPIGTRPSEDGSIPGVVSWITPFFTSPYLDGLGNTRAQVLLSWAQPLNTDGSTILDGDHYEIRYGFHPVLADEWQSVFAAWGNETTLIQDLAPGLAYDIGIRAVDRYGHAGVWSVTEQITVAPDTIPPSTPAAATLAASRIAIQVKHELGKSSGGTYNLEIDLDHLEIHVGTVTGFTPAESTLVGKLPANVGMLVAEVPAIGTFQVESTTAIFVKVIAVDGSGNKSPASTSATATALLIDNAHISDLTVSKVTAGTISAAWIVGASIGTASSGARVVLNTTGLHGFNSGGIETVSLLNTGSFTLRSNSSGARIELDPSGFRAYNSGGTQTVDVSASTGNATIIGQLSSAFSGARIVVSPTGASTPEIRFYPSSGSAYSRIYLPPDGWSQTYIKMETPFNPATSRTGILDVGISGGVWLRSIGSGSSNSHEIIVGISDAIEFSGKFAPNAPSWTAMHQGSAVASGTAGIVSYPGIFANTLWPIITPHAGNAVGHAVSNANSSTFQWSVSVGLSGSDRITWWAIRI